MANKSRETANLVSSSGVSTFRSEVDFTNGPVQIGSATSTGTADQKLQVTGGSYISGSVGIATTNPNSILEVYGDGNRINFVNSPVWLRPNTGGSIGTALELGTLNDFTAFSQYSVLTADAYENTAEFLDASDLLDIRSNRYNSFIHLSHADPVGVRTAFSIRHSYGDTNNEIRIHDAGQPATRIRLASNTYSYITNRVGIGSTIPNSDVDLDIGNGVNVGSLGTAFYIKKDGRIGIGTTVSSTAPQNSSKIFIDARNENRKIIALRGETEHKWSGEVSTGSSLGGGQYDPPGTMVSMQNTGGAGIAGNTLVTMTAYSTNQNATGIYFGASPGSTTNGPADFVLGRRTATQSWKETLRITHAGDNNKQFLGFGTENASSYDPIYIAGSIHQRPYNIGHTETGLTYNFDSSNTYKMKLVGTYTNSSGIAGIVTTGTFGSSPDQYDYVRRNFNTYFTTGSTAFNQNLCEIDCSNGLFQQIAIYIVWATRIQGVSDSATQVNQRLYGANKFNTLTGAFSINSYLTNVNASSLTHMDIEVVDKGSGVLAIQYQQSASAGGASFTGGYIEIFGCGLLLGGSTSSDVKIKWNV